MYEPFWAAGTISSINGIEMEAIEASPTPDSILPNISR
jgi:hypothetical protein